MCIMSEKYKEFDVFEVPLEGTNLIEASAGTGKTHSVALLALRMILERQMTIDQILMVTFTIDAAAEMKVRLRGFLREAARRLRHQAHDVDLGVIRVVDDALRQSSGDVAHALKLVEAAELDFDKASVFTIHGFCARMLAEYAFESKQVFRAKTVEPDAWNMLVDDAFYHAWRLHITTLPADVLKFLFDEDFSMQRVRDLVKGGLNGQKILVEGGLFPPVESINDWIEWFRTQSVEIPTHTKTAKAEFVGSMVAVSVNILAHFLHKQIAEELERRKQQDGLVTFDDMIKGMRDVICAEKNQEHGILTDLLRARFSAVFIDEFQDTDPWQFDIFSNVFGRDATGHVVFYIGDPKQSIYGFRRADLNNYFRASDSAKSKWIMPKNYRSTLRYVAAMNEYFQPAGKDAAFNLFQHEKLTYQPVQAPETPKWTGGLRYGGNEVDPIRILWCKDAPDILQRTVALVAELLRRPLRTDEGYSWFGTHEQKRVEAGQIGILVRTNREGRRIKERLARRSIPSVVVGDARILESAEALEIYYVLLGVWRMTPGDIRRALLTTPGGHFWSDLEHLAFDELLDEFRSYQSLWKERGVYACLHQFVSRSGLVSAYLKGDLAHSERSVANVFQLMEVLHEAETDKKLSPEELLFWMKRGMEGERSEENEHLQRIESDESAVKIVTIHSCKGLEYDLVIAPYLDLESTDKHKTARFRKSNRLGDHDATGHSEYERSYASAGVDSSEGGDSALGTVDYISEKKAFSKLSIGGEAPADLARKQVKEENMRLLYVAITRARFQAFVFTRSKPMSAPKAASRTKAAVASQAGERTASTAQGHLLEAYGSFGSAQFFKYVGFGAEKVSMQAGGEAQEDAVDGKDDCPWTYFKPNAPEFGFKLRPAGTGTHSSPSGGGSMASESAPSGVDSMASEAAASDTAVPPTAEESVVLEVSIESDLSDWAPEAPAIELPDLNWRKLSYSGLSKKTESHWRTKRESAAAHTEYDRFIFQHLRSGTQTGIMLHELFERIDFQSSEHWQRHIQQALKRYPAGVRTPDGDGHLRIQEMLHILTRTALGANGPVLQDVPRNRRLNEASFHLPLRKMDCAGLLNWADQRSIGLNIPESGSLEGLLNGVVDLFFEHKGRYYILDWKSDRLGDTVDDYDLPLLEQAMAERNYTLQYYLYTLALYRYLKHRITGFDYERHFGGVFYVFLRGVREGSDRGIYHRKPPLGDVLALEERMLAHA